MFSSDDSTELAIPSYGSRRLLSESPLQRSSSISTGAETGHGGNDLSLSELSLADRPGLFTQPFSLLSRPEPVVLEAETERETDLAEAGERASGSGDEEACGESDLQRTMRQTVNERTREDKLKSDLFLLKKLNASLALLNDAMDETSSANERLAAQIDQTDQLLSRYVTMLSKSANYAKLVFDERWLGAGADQAQLERENAEAQEAERRAAEERERELQREKERIERETREREEREAAEQAERERRERAAASRGGVRGVRGTRASMRAQTRGGTRGSGSSSSLASGRGRTPPGASGIPSRRPPSSSSGTTNRG